MVSCQSINCSPCAVNLTDWAPWITCMGNKYQIFQRDQHQQLSKGTQCWADKGFTIAWQ